MVTKTGMKAKFKKKINHFTLKVSKKKKLVLKFLLWVASKLYQAHHCIDLQLHISCQNVCPKPGSLNQMLQIHTYERSGDEV